MIDRYSRPEMTKVWSEQSKLNHWLAIEILAIEGRVKLGDVPARDLEEIRSKVVIDADEIRERELTTRHDVAAFVDQIASRCGKAGRHIHYGMTSSDVLDTAFALQLRASADLLLKGLDELIVVTVELARAHARTPIAGRTHGVHAEVTTFGAKVAGWAFEMDRARERLRSAKGSVSVGKLSGTVGNYSQLPPSVETYVCEQLGLMPDSASTQIVSRDRHAEFMSALAILSGSLDRIATEIRHLSRTEVGELAEGFTEGVQKGSSAMPHKRNPVRCERVCGLARLVRAYVAVAVESIASWHERDISHSSAERVIFPDACLAVDFIVAEMTDVLQTLVVFPERMRTNIDASHGLMFSHALLLRLIDSGLLRDEAYQMVQSVSTVAMRENKHLLEVALETRDVASRLGEDELKAAFSIDTAIRQTSEIIDRLEKI